MNDSQSQGNQDSITVPPAAVARQVHNHAYDRLHEVHGMNQHLTHLLLWHGKAEVQRTTIHAKRKTKQLATIKAESEPTCSSGMARLKSAMMDSSLTRTAGLILGHGNTCTKGLEKTQLGENTGIENQNNREGEPGGNRGKYWSLPCCQSLPQRPGTPPAPKHKHDAI